MFEFQRLAKEDYELMGRSFTWTTDDARVLLTSFEMEVSGVFGDSQELFQFVRRADRETLQELDIVFHGIWHKWFEFLWKCMGSGDLPYANALKKSELNDPAEPGATVDEYLSRCNIVPSELLECISKAVNAGELDFDLETFQGFLNGHASAPERYVRVVEVEKEIPPSEYFRSNAQKRHEADKPKHKALLDFLMEDLSGACTCTKCQAVKRIFRDRYKNDEEYLKFETGYSHLSFTRQVSKALQQIEQQKPKDQRINRHENTKGFSLKKVPPCIKHPSK